MHGGEVDARPASWCTARPGWCRLVGDDPLFAGLPDGVRGRPLPLAGRRRAAARPSFVLTARADDGEVMAMRHRERAHARRAVPPRVRADARRPATPAKLPGARAVKRDAGATLLGRRATSASTSARERDGHRHGAARRRPPQIAGFLVALRAKGETRRRDRRLRLGDARARRADAPAAHRPGRGRRHRRRRRRHVQHLDRRRDPGRGRGRRGRRQARQPRDIVEVRRSADVLEALGVAIDLPPEAVATLIDEVGFGFLFAPNHHPAMRYAGPGAPRARRADRDEPARPADQPRRRCRRR